VNSARQLLNFAFDVAMIALVTVAIIMILIAWMIL